MSSASSLILIDGPSGVGKTTLAAELQQYLASQGAEPFVLHLDDLYPGWNGLQAGSDIAAELLRARARREKLRWQRYDWTTEAHEEWVELAPEHSLIVEGCGALNAHTAELADVRIWLDAPYRLRRERALSREGEDYDAHWAVWNAQFDEYVRTHRPRAFANMTRVLTR